MRSEVAINPSQPFLPGYYKTLAQQEEMIEEFSQEIGKKVPGVEAIMGHAADYAELVFAHLDRAKEFLIATKYTGAFVRTKTPTSDTHFVIVNVDTEGHRLTVNFQHAVADSVEIQAVPLVVPASPKLQQNEPV